MILELLSGPTAQMNQPINDYTLFDDDDGHDDLRYKIFFFQNDYFKYFMT